MTSVTGQARELESEEFRDIIGRFASGVTVITAAHDGQRRGSTASAVSSLSLEPPMVLVCLNRSSSTAQAVSAAGHFAVNILGEDQAEEAMRFARPAAPGQDKFDGVGVESGVDGAPLLTGALATLECTVAEEVTGGTHTVFLSRVDRASAGTGSPLAYFRGRFGRLSLDEDEHVFADIRGRVLNRELPAGESFRLDDLAATLGYPRGPVYHALTRLAGEGLVSHEASGEYTVTPLTLEAVRAAWRARCAIELGVLRVTVAGASEEQVAELRRLAGAAEPAPAGEFAFDTWLPRYGAFLDGLVGLGDSPPLLDAYRRVNAPAMILSLTRQRMEEMGADREQAASAHRHLATVAEAYARRDLGAATEAILAHEQLARRVGEQFMDRHGGTM